ncbi:Pentatricopeptide repeat-containing protein, partial [Cucurbita argyrosperma subsp. argyrosperma]
MASVIPPDLCSLLLPAHRVFFDMKSERQCPNVVSCSTLIDGYCRVGNVSAAEEDLFLVLLSYNSIIPGLSKEGSCMRAYQLLVEGMEFGYSPSEHTYKVFAKANDNGTLVLVLQSNCQPDVITLHTVMKGFCKVETIGEALKVLNDMMIGKFCVPDEVTFNYMWLTECLEDPGIS